MKVIPYGRQNITQQDIDAVIEALTSDFLTQGPRILEFEEKFARYVDAKYAVAVSNGTAALHLATMALGVTKGDKVITTPITFAASANCVRYCGGEVVFADIDPNTYLLDPNCVRDLLKTSPKGTYKGIIPVDFAGRAVDLEAFRSLADEFGCWIIEDACHSPGGYFTDSKGVKQFCGNGQYAEFAVFSFHPVKHIALGEGGMITTNDEALYNKLLMLRTHGITREPSLFVNDKDFASSQKHSEQYPGWYMEMQTLGYNYRLTDFQCALGTSQLKRADEGIAKRKSIAAKYKNAFENQPFIVGHSDLVEGHAYHLYVLEVKDRLGLYNYLRKHGIYAQIHYIPVHLMPYYRNLGWKEGDLPLSENYYGHCISLPMFPTLTDEEQSFVIRKILDYYEK